MNAVRLLDGPFKEAQQTDKRYMLSLDPDRLLAPFRREAGLPAKAASYGNWENTGLDGHIGGHYLSALSLMYASTGEERVKQRLDYMIDQLEQCQQANGDGYIGGIPGGKAMWAAVAAGKIDAGAFSLNQKWVPLYNIHKLYAGLYDAWAIAGNQKAKTLLLKLCDWCVKLTANLSDEQIQQMLRSEHGGLNEVFADVAAATGDQRYLALARRFSDRHILDPLLQQKDMLTGMHANTQIPKVIGYKRIAEVAQDTAWARAADFFWNTVVRHRTVSIGGNSVREHFHPASDFSSMVESREGPETCNSYNMLKLTRHLFLTRPSNTYMDYYERTLYNHILSSQSPTGGFVYFTPMRPQHYRVYSQPQEGFWCCVGSGLENHGKYGELIYAHTNNDLYINLFIHSTLEWKEKGLKLTQETAFPFEDKSQIRLSLAKPARFTVYVRNPSWVTPGTMRVYVNKKQVAIRPDGGSYIAINRLWKSNDIISIHPPQHTEVERLPDSSQWVSFVRGPIVLAAATDTAGLDGLFADGSRMGHVAGGPLVPQDEAPLIVGESNNMASALLPYTKNLTTLSFTAPALFYQPKYKKLVLRPFFRVHNSRYVIYFPYTRPENLEQVKKAMQEKEQARMALETITVDVVYAGEQQPESDHAFKGEQTETGYFRERHFRNAKGWFSYDLRNAGGQAKKLRVTYYGRERNRSFDIYVNDVLLSTVKMEGTGPDAFTDVDYALPESLLNNPPSSIRVKFAAQPNAATANIFEVRLLK
ncbi:glycoside hydrolase family 127 protein [Paraflavitalea devenefica]|uniref:glycoside hydrolase family 127 protein n=1 Tax=Paraflavitalea devenefica TaxID=2716334 RepID=UPI001ABBCCD1|nr:glycoside hydrolase family 127 protein [Paraflavitalea devenefica]